MARDPGSLWWPLPESGRQGTGVKRKFIVHSTGTRASAAANARYFAQAGVVVESTFIVGLDPSDPTRQLLDSTEVADANGTANDEGISVEVVGGGADPFTPWQLAELVRLGRWAHDTHGIPLQVIPSPAQDAGGYGWHVMFGAPGPWTEVIGKVCPGAVRIRQLQADVFPRIFDREDQDLTPEQDRLLRAVHDKLSGVADQVGGPLQEFQGRTLVQSLAWLLREDGSPLLLAAARQADPTALAGALRPLLAEAVAAGMAADNKAQAQAIVDQLVRRLAGTA